MGDKKVQFLFLLLCAVIFGAPTSPDNTSVAFPKISGLSPRDPLATMTSPNFSGLNSTPFVNSMTSCGQPVMSTMQGLGNMMTLGAQGGMSQMPVCPMISPSLSPLTACPNVVPPQETYSCQSFGANLSGAGQIVKQLDFAFCAAQCTDNLIKLIQAQFGCVMSQYNGLTQQAGMMAQNGFLPVFTEIQKGRQIIQSTLDDYVAKTKEVDEWLTGASGLEPLLTEAQQFLLQMPTERTQINTQMKGIISAQRGLTEMRQKETTARAMECFNTNPQGNLQCDPNGPAVSPKEYALCRLYQNAHVSSGGVIERGKLTEAQSKAQEQRLRALFDQMAAGSPNSTQAPTDAKSAVAYQAQRVFTPDVESMIGTYKNSLSTLVGPSYTGFIIDALKACNARAKREVNNEMGMASSALGEKMTNLKAQGDQLAAVAQTTLDRQALQYSKIQSKLNFTNTPQNTALCGEYFQLSKLDSASAQEARYAQGMTCFDQSYNKMKSVINGDGSPGTSKKIEIAGNNPATRYQVPCSGLAGCVTALRKEKQTLTRNVQAIGQYQEQYKQYVNTSIMRSTQAAGQQLSMISGVLANQMTILNAAAASLGINMGAARPMQSEPPKYDAQGFLMQPQNPFAFLSGFVQPPLNDPASISQVQSAVASLATSQDAKLARIINARATLSNQVEGCRAEMVDSALVPAMTAMSSAQNCYAEQDICSEGKLAELETTVTRAMASLGAVPSTALKLQNLSTGMRQACAQPNWEGRIPRHKRDEVMVKYKNDPIAQKRALDQLIDEAQQMNQMLSVNTGNCARAMGMAIGAVKMLPTTQGSGNGAPTSGMAW